MPPKSKSIFRQPGAKHFHLVHRSQRDPLINDPDASQHVLKPFERDNVKKGKSRAELEDLLSEDIATDHLRPNIGEASLYGVYYDDTEYDYMQHLRQVGMQEDGVESVLIEAPSTSTSKAKKSKSKSVLDIPEEALASTYELPRTYESQQAIPESIAGFQPDMDPHLRQVLEALEDDAFVDDTLEDDFFQELVVEGERGDDEEFEFAFAEAGVSEETSFDTDGTQTKEDTWEDRFSKFKKDQEESKGANSDDEYASEGGDTIGTLQTMSVIGGKKRRRKGTSDASGYSMSSSSMFRHEGLKTLDERFDQIMLKEYENDDLEEPQEEEEDQPLSDDDSEEAPELITSRDDFDGMINEFLNDYEILGRKMRQKLEGETGAEKLETMRRAMGQDDRVRLQDGDGDSDDVDLEYVEEEKKDRWDCETILTTYSNLENHPRLIRARNSKPTPKISLDSKTGMPVVTSIVTSQPDKRISTSHRVSFSNSEDTEESDSDTTTTVPRHPAVGRPRNESKDEKRARKAAVKAEKQTRRVERKALKEQFDVEMQAQKKNLAQKEVKMKKL